MRLLSPDIPDCFPARAVLSRPAVRLWLAMASGILIAHEIGEWVVRPALVVGLFASVAMCVVRHAGWRLVLLLLATGAASAGWAGLRSTHGPVDSVGRLLDREPMLVEVVGVVRDQPRARLAAPGALSESGVYAPPAVRFMLEIERVRRGDGSWVSGSGVMYVRVQGEAEISARAGDRIRAIGGATALRAPGNPGAIDPRPAATQRGVVGSLQLDGSGALEVVETTTGLAGPLQRVRAGVLEQITEAGKSVQRPDAAALLGALLLGDRDARGLRELEESFTRTGVGHFLAISGLHVGLVLVGLVYLVRISGDRPKLEFAMVILAAVLLLAFIPARPPVLRAVLIALALVVAQSGGRSYDRLSLLALVGSGLLIWRPLDLLNPGYQLTFLVVAGLLVCGGALRFRLFGDELHRDERRGWRHVLERLKDALAVSLCASAISVPLIALHFGMFSPLAAGLSVVLLPLLALILGTGYLALVIGALVPGWADGLLSLALHPAVWLADVVSWFDVLPGVAVYLPRMSWALGIMVLVVLVWWMYPSLAMIQRRRVATVLVALPIAWSMVVGPSVGGSVALRMDALDVGDGTAILLRRGRDAVLYDCGSRWLGIGEREIPRAVRALGAGRVRTVIISHPDTDHYSGLLDAARPLGVRRVLVPPQMLEQALDRPDGTTAFLIGRLREMGIRVEAIARGDTIPLGGLGIEVLHPDREDRMRRDNDASIVLRLRPASAVDGPMVMLTGDIEREGMRLLEEREGQSLRADVIEVPHHGSARSFAYPFVEGLNPRILIQSTGPSRLLDERWDIVREGRLWFTTASDGAVTVIIKADGSIEASGFR